MLNNEDYMKIFHEIKNSIAIISSYMQLVEKKHPEISAFDYWADSMNEVSRLRTIVTELSQIKLGSGLKPEKIDVCRFISGVCGSLSCMDREDGITFQFHHTSDPLTAVADPNQLRLACLNLLKNSCEAMNQTGTILVETGRQESMAYIKLTDSGGGLAPEITEHIFDPFITTKENGSGLGLVITRQIIEAHNGTLVCESRPGDGCTFYLHLPAAD